MRKLFYALALLASSILYAAPAPITVQGVLRDSANAPYTYSATGVTIRLKGPAPCNGANGCDQVTGQTVDIVNGAFSVSITPSTALATMAGNTSGWTVEVEGVMANAAPSTVFAIPLNALPFASVADMAATATSVSTEAAASIAAAINASASTINAANVAGFSGNLIGDVTGTQSVTVIEKIRGISIPAPPGNILGMYLRGDSANSMSWQGLGVNLGTAEATGILTTNKGGTGISVTGDQSGKVLIGKADGTFALTSLTAGSNITLTPGDGTLQIAASGGGSSAGSAQGQIQRRGAAAGSFEADANFSWTGTTLAVAGPGTLNTYVGVGAGSASAAVGTNTAFGASALAGNTGDGNTAFGKGALDANNSAHGNAAFGTDALGSNTTGTFNTALGSSALFNNTGGTYNVAIGRALDSNTTGSFNVAIGDLSLDYANTRSNNTAVGTFALSNFDSNSQTAVGYGALLGNPGISTGTGNTALGYLALTATQSGSDNTAVGQNAGDLVTTGSNNVFLGAGADAAAVDTSNAVAIGRNASAASNEIVLGNTSNTVLKMPLTSAAVGRVLTTDASGNATWQNLWVSASQNTNYTVLAADNRKFFVSNPAGAITFSLPAIAGLPDGFSVGFFHSGGANNITIQANGAETIAGSNSQTITPGTGFTLIKTASGWFFFNKNSTAANCAADNGGNCLINAASKAAVDSDLAATNIRTGVDIFGVTGSGGKPARSQADCNSGGSNFGVGGSPAMTYVAGSSYTSGFCIESAYRTSASGNYAGVDAACTAAGRHLCNLAELRRAYNVSAISPADYLYAGDFNYNDQCIPSLGNIQAWHCSDASSSPQYYCCGNNW